MSNYRIPIHCYTAVDLASSKNKDASRTVVLTGGMDYRKNLFLLDAWVKLGAHPFETMQEITRQATHFKCRQVGIERNRYEAFLDMYKFLLNDETIGSNFENLRIVEIEHYGSDANKDDRIVDTLQHRTQAHRIWLRMQDTVLSNHFATFPQCEFKDILDALEMLAQICTPPPKDTLIAGDQILNFKPHMQKSYNPLTMSWDKN